MVKPKYLVLRFAEIREVLSLEEKKAIKGIIEKITAARTQKGETDPAFFTLNMRDEYAQPAIEAYISAIQGDPTSVGNAGCFAALEAAQEARTKGIMAGDAHKPNQPRK